MLLLLLLKAPSLSAHQEKNLAFSSTPTPSSKLSPLGAPSSSSPPPSTWSSPPSSPPSDRGRCSHGTMQKTKTKTKKKKVRKLRRAKKSLRRRINEDVSNEPVDFPKNLISIPDCVSPIIETAYTKTRRAIYLFLFGKGPRVWGNSSEVYSTFRRLFFWEKTSCSH